MRKKIVHYDGEIAFLGIGTCAYLTPIDHPSVSNTKTVRTSSVVSFNKETGILETENTIYQKQKGEANA